MGRSAELAELISYPPNPRYCPYELRTQAGLTQRQLAKLVGTSTSAICRLEDADYERHSLSMLRRIAAALSKRVEIRFVPTARWHRAA